MKRILALSCAFLILNPFSQSLASDIPFPGKKPDFVRAVDFKSIDNIQISKKGDLELECSALTQEAIAMRDVISELENLKDKSNMQSNGVTAAGAVGSFLIGTVTGGIGLAVGGLLIDHNISEDKQKTDELQDIAEQRRILMMGIFNAKGCEGTIEQAMSPNENTTDKMAAIQPASGEKTTSQAPRADIYNQ